jgi:hypothetical protein
MRKFCRWCYIVYWSVLLMLPALPVAKAQDSTPVPVVFQPVAYWDMGLLIGYPQNWPPPRFGLDQLVLSPSSAALDASAINAPIIAFRFVDPVRDLRLSKDADYQTIAAALSGANQAGVGDGISVMRVDEGRFAGLRAGLVEADDTARGLHNLVLVFRLLDGRLAAMIILSPADQWAENAPLFNQIASNAQLLLPAAYTPANVIPSDRINVASGKFSFALPSGWVRQTLADTALLIHHPDDARYTDDSGYANGPQLMLRAEPLVSSNWQAAVAQLLGEQGGGAQITVGGQPAVQYTITDPTNDQRLTFIGFPSRDFAKITVLRWTTPAALSAVAQPILDAILASVQLD